MANQHDNHTQGEPDLMDEQDIPPGELEDLQETISESDIPKDNDLL